MALILRIDIGSEIPAYRQIADALRQALVGGALKTGTTLPTVRQLAMDLGVHFNTVAEAYRILAEEGWLELRRRRGALVIERGTLPAPPAEDKARLSRHLRELIAKMRSAGWAPQEIAAEMKLAVKELASR